MFFNPVVVASSLLVAAKVSLAASCSDWYGQCGGVNYNGTTCCKYGSKCVYSNSFYSQCLLFDSEEDKACVPVYGQCGGIGYSGPTCCHAGTECVYSNDWFSQCMPVEGTEGPDPAAPGTPEPVVCAPKWGQCGGLSHTGPTCCEEGTVCVYSNDWYSQCLSNSTYVKREEEMARRVLV